MFSILKRHNSIKVYKWGSLSPQLQKLTRISHLMIGHVTRFKCLMVIALLTLRKKGS